MNELFHLPNDKKPIPLYKQRNPSSVQLNGASILGDNLRDFKRDMEITKMNSFNSNITLTNPTSNSNYSQNARKLPSIAPVHHTSSFPLTPLKQLPHNNSASNITGTSRVSSIPLSQYTELSSEISKLKSAQSELQHKLQENESRLNEVIVSFNNYTQLSEQSAQTIHNIQSSVESFISKQELLELKNALFTISKTNENNIHDLFLKMSTLNMHINELTQDNETYKKYVNDTIQHIYTDTMQSRFAHQNELFKLEENKEMKLLLQVNQMKNSICNVERSIRDESELRKQMVDNIRNDISNLIKQQDEKFKQLQSNVKDTENNVAKSNKECLGSLNELVEKNKEYYESELNTVRSIIETGLSKLNFKLENDNQIYKDNLTKIKHSIYAQKNKINEIDDCLKDTIQLFQKSVH